MRSGTIVPVTDDGSPSPEPNNKPDSKLKSLGWTDEQRDALGKITAANASYAALRESVIDSSKKLSQSMNFKPWEEVANQQREMRDAVRPHELFRNYPEPTFEVFEPAENPLVKPVGELVQLNASLLEEQQRMRTEAVERDKSAAKLAWAVLVVAVLTLIATVTIPLFT